MSWSIYLTAALFIWNTAVFILYGIDKRKARCGGWRISEKTLLLAAAFMGGPGALLGMYIFRHKTRHLKFKLGVPLLLIANVIIAVVIANGLGHGSESVQYRKISAEEAKAMIDTGDVVILDVRTEDEYSETHIPDAILIPDTKIRELVPDLLPDKNLTILVYCRTGVRSERAARALVEMGYTEVYDFGGIVDWPYETVAGQ